MYTTEGIKNKKWCDVCRLHKKMKATSEVSYPAYGVTGPAGSPPGKDGSPGDRKLAQSAQMYHYQHQKQQMIASERYVVARTVTCRSQITILVLKEIW